MTQIPHPFPPPVILSSDLGRVRDYWSSLKRGENAVPFADDVKLSALPGFDGRLMLVEVFEKPAKVPLEYCRQ
jgi:hypothetical protein